MKEITFLELFRKYINHFSNSLDRFERRSKATIKIYSNKYNIIGDYLFSVGLVKLKALSFCTNVCEDYFIWLDNKQYAHNYSVRCVQICIDVLDFGAQKGIIPHNPSIYYKKKRIPPAEPLYFNPEQINKFENYLSSSSEKQKGADMFTLQIHTGISYGDFKEIKRHHVLMFKGIKYFVKPRHKTANKQIVPLHPVAEAILEKYDYKLQLLANATYNRILKDLARDLDINYPLKCKDGRTLFMMNKLNNEGYSIEAVSRMGGHKTIRTTETYYAQTNINLVHNELMKRMA